MALQASGPISLANIQTEFGGANPISITEYYGADTGVPASGTISLSDFYGKSNVDVTPTWTNWTEFNLGPGSDVSSTATFSSINQAITLKFDASLSVSGTSVSIFKNGALQFSLAESQTNNLSISSGDNVYVTYSDTGTPGTANLNGQLSVTNTSDGGAIIKSWGLSSWTGVGGGL